ncbi:hypothetical protein [Pelagicoccus mobilis]|uniref:DUF3108 domain-containing protein n=1 Tax=Pelagicoccus mobilis TaxID=415221 RepID=A0A934VTV1_9BACT|nr:hypothetical protein [Pelagicoccus mobilis]MBK1880103.1 hypothetical protein [Pelagicoccus mobilis]
MFTRFCSFTASLPLAVIALSFAHADGVGPKVDRLTGESAEHRRQAAEEILRQSAELYGLRDSYSCRVDVKKVRSYSIAYDDIKSGGLETDRTSLVYRYRLEVEYRSPEDYEISWSFVRSSGKTRLNWTISRINGEYHWSDYREKPPELTVEPDLRELIDAVDSSCFGLLSFLNHVLDPSERLELLDDNLVLLRTGKKDGRKCYVIAANKFTDKKIWVDCETYEIRRIEYSPSRKTVEKEIAYRKWKEGDVPMESKEDEEELVIAAAIVNPAPSSKYEIVFRFRENVEALR